MTFQCDPCNCPDQHTNHIITWRKAVITCLCRIGNALGSMVLGPGTAHIGSVSIDGAITVTEPVTVDGTVDIGNTVTVTGSVNADVTGTVSVSNFPATQPVSGTVAVSNFPATQPVSGTVTVNGTVNATCSGTVAVSNFPATQPVSGTVTPAVAACTHVTEVSTEYTSLNDSTYTQILANANALRLVTITNTMDVPASISFNGTNPHHTVPAGAGMVLDLASDGLTAVGNIYALRKEAGATKGKVSIGGMY